MVPLAERCDLEGEERSAALGRVRPSAVGRGNRTAVMDKALQGMP
jgi:hypothetical protein